MNLEQIEDEEIATEVIWISSENVAKKMTNTKERSWRRVVDKHYKRIEYLNEDKKPCSGYSAITSSVSQPFALYIRNIYGDGIYYTNQDINKNYILAISNGEVIEGTDIYVNNALFEKYRQFFLSDDYSSLSWICLTAAHIDEVLEANNLHKQKIKKKKITYLSVMSITGIVFLLLFYIALKSFLVT